MYGALYKSKKYYDYHTGKKATNHEAIRASPAIMAYHLSTCFQRVCSNCTMTATRNILHCTYCTMAAIRFSYLCLTCTVINK